MNVFCVLDHKVPEASGGIIGGVIGAVSGTLVAVGLGAVLLVLCRRGIIGRCNMTIVLFKQQQQHTNGLELSIRDVPIDRLVIGRFSHDRP